tara:strand:- start:3 stop:158 length:156 start_codon:yes stop_codon:yes gene_type:complete
VVVVIVVVVVVIVATVSVVARRAFIALRNGRVPVSFRRLYRRRRGFFVTTP